MKADLYVGLVHSPVYNRRKEVITTSVTNLDIHDLARTCFTFGVRKYFLITPVVSQQELIRKILRFWGTDRAREYNPDRKQAMDIIEISSTIEEAKEYIKNQEGSVPLVITTTARASDHQLHFSDFSRVYQEKRPILLLFGTGNGLIHEIHDQADETLEPIYGHNEYNHLSVRSAAAIILDRISSVEYKEETWTSFKP